MLEGGLDIAIKRYLDTLDQATKSAIFEAYIYPELEDIINGVILSLNIAGLPKQDLEDIKQYIYLKVLLKVETKRLTGVRSAKNYFFISIKNLTISYLRSENVRLKFDLKIYNIVNNNPSNE